MIGLRVFFADDGEVKSDRVRSFNPDDETVVLDECSEQVSLETVYLSPEQVPGTKVVFENRDMEDDDSLNIDEVFSTPGIYVDLDDPEFFLLVVGDVNGRFDNVGIYWPKDGCEIVRMTKEDFISDSRFKPACDSDDDDDMPVKLNFCCVSG